MKTTRKKTIINFSFFSSTLICSCLFGLNLFAAEMSQQEIEMRKMVLEMVRTSMLQSCEGLQTLDCIDLDETSCKKMMSEVISTCIEPAIDDPDYVDDGNCGKKVMAKYDITEESAQRCGVKLEE